MSSAHFGANVLELAIRSARANGIRRADYQADYITAYMTGFGVHLPPDAPREVEQRVHELLAAASRPAEGTETR